MFKKTLLLVSALCFAACSNPPQEDVAALAAPAETAPMQKGNCNAAYTAHLGRCENYTCTEGAPDGLEIVRTVKGREGDWCVESVVTKSAGKTPAPEDEFLEEDETAQEQICAYRAEQLPVAADYLSRYYAQNGNFWVHSDVSASLTAAEDENPFAQFAQDGTCAWAVADSADVDQVDF